MRIIDDITDYIFVEDAVEKADIIFVPGCSNPTLPERAAQLYTQGYAPMILPSGRASVKIGKFLGAKIKGDLYNGPYETECDFYVDVLMKNGVPEEAILREDRSGYTWQNALLSREVVDANGLKVTKAIVCCKSFHARRCLMAYQMTFPEAELVVVPCDVDGIRKGTWYMSEYGIDRVLGELN